MRLLPFSSSGLGLLGVFVMPGDYAAFVAECGAYTPAFAALTGCLPVGVGILSSTDP